MNNRVAVFIGSGYVSKVLSNDVRMDFMKFCDKACGDKERLRTYFYDCMPYQSEPPTEDEKTDIPGIANSEIPLRSSRGFRCGLDN